MSILIVRPQGGHKAYEAAAEAFRDLCHAVTGVLPGIVTDQAAIQALPAHPDLQIAVIGGDETNLLAREYGGEVPVRVGTDDYGVFSATLRGHDALLLWGGRGRSTLYAVYRYFENCLGCRWFWDGDRIPKRKELPFRNVSLVEKTDKLYRGTRYFAHRGLHRFQAEHWNLEDWKREIDWLLKKRLNLLMLRIGQDDLFQKAFPDLVPYPSATDALPFEGDGFNDRTLFWDLQFRGDLRKQVLQYAKDRDLLTPEDCGTMTHWYSRTPVEFLEKKRPSLLSQPRGTNYNQATGLVWDIRKEENLDDYFRLTDTHVREYGQAGLFHTIGLAERLFSADRQENLQLKKLTYRLLCRRLREKYPGSKLLLTSWDLWMFYTPEEVRELLTQLDPEQVVLFDYTSDSARESNLQTWGVENRFPYVFGIFHAYQPSNEIRGDYQMLTQRLNRIKDDPFCKGVVLWPELSHGDPFMIEFFARNAWEVSGKPVEEQLADFCRDRYTHGEEMRELWERVLPLAPLMSWSKYQEVTPWVETDVFCRGVYTLDFGRDEPRFDDYLRALEAHRLSSAEALEGLAELIPHADPMERRDCMDLARTVITRYLNGICLHLCRTYGKGQVDRLCDTLLELTSLYAALLAGEEEYSLYHTLEKLKETAPVNPAFAPTLKRNCDNLYCRSAVYECVQELYLPELECLTAMLRGGTYDKSALMAQCKKNQQTFEQAELKKPVPTGDAADLLRQCGRLLRERMHLC